MGSWAFGLICGYGDLTLTEGLERHEANWKPMTFQRAVKETREMFVAKELAVHLHTMALLAGVIEARSLAEQRRAQVAIERDEKARVKAINDDIVKRGAKKRRDRARKLASAGVVG